MSDIKFVGDDVVIEGRKLQVSCFDVKLDNPGRRSTNAGQRRALVHDFQDGLTLNWNNDYPGGVTINGNVNVPDGATVDLLRGTVLLCTHHTLKLDNPTRRKLQASPANPRVPLRKTQRRALVHDTNDGLTVNFNADYPGGVTIRGKVSMPEKLIVKGVDIFQTIAALQAQNAALEARVLALEAA